MVKSEKILNCGKCETGEVKVVVKDTKNTREISVKKCTFCKYQYGIKGLQDLNGKKIAIISTEK